MCKCLISTPMKVRKFLSAKSRWRMFFCLLSSYQKPFSLGFFSHLSSLWALILFYFHLWIPFKMRKRDVERNKTSLRCTSLSWCKNHLKKRVPFTLFKHVLFMILLSNCYVFYYQTVSIFEYCWSTWIYIFFALETSTIVIFVGGE